MARRTKAEALETRQLILDAAEQVFFARGVARTSLKDVADAAGLTRGAIYWHFKDKVELFIGMMDRAILPCEQAVLLASQESELEPRQALEAIAMAPLIQLQHDSKMQRLFHIATSRTEYTEDMRVVSQRHLDSVASYQQRLLGVLQRAADDQTLPAPACHQRMAIALFALVNGLMLHWIQTEQGFELVATGQAAIRALLGGLFSVLPAAGPAASYCVAAAARAGC